MSTCGADEALRVLFASTEAGESCPETAE